MVNLIDMADFGIWKRVRDLWRNGLLTDLEIVVQDQTFKVHKLVVVAISKYFQAMLCDNYIESEQQKIELKGLDGNVFGKLLELLYTGDSKVITGYIVEVLNCAVYLQMDPIIDLCASKVHEELSPSTCLDVYQTLLYFSCYDQAADTEEYIQRNFQQICELHHNVTNIPFNILEVLVKLWHKSEWDLLKILSEWYEAGNPITSVDKLMANVRFCLISKSKIKSVLNMKIYKDSDGSWKENVEKEMTYHDLPVHLKILDMSEHAQFRNKPAPTYFISGAEEIEAGNTWKLNVEEWEKYPTLIKGVPAVDRWEKHQTVVVNNFLIVRKRDELFAFDPIALSWSKLTSIANLESNIVHHKGNLYIFGDNPDDYDVQKLVRYNLLTNVVQSFEVPFGMYNPLACICGDTLYVAGSDSDEDEAKVTVCDIDVSRDQLKSDSWRIRGKRNVPIPWYTARKIRMAEINGQNVLFVMNSIMELMYFVLCECVWFKFHSTVPYYPNDCDVIIRGPIVCDGDEVYAFSACHCDFANYPWHTSIQQTRFCIKYDISFTEMSVKYRTVGEFPFQEPDDPKYEPLDDDPSMIGCMLALPFVD